MINKLKVTSKGKTEIVQETVPCDDAQDDVFLNELSSDGTKKDRDFPKSWRLVAIKDIADSIQYGHTASAVKREDGPRFLRITDIQDGQVDWDSVPSCDIPKEEIAKYRLTAGDLVFARTGATTGKSFLIKDCPEAVFASYLIRVRVSEKVDSRYLSAFFQSPDYWNQIEGGKRGIGQPNVNGTVLGGIKFPLAPLPEQRRIVAEIEKQFTRLEAGVNSLRRVQANLKRYRASVLKVACEGRLVPTEVELVAAASRRSSNDNQSRDGSATFESGQALLARILSERRKNWQGRGKYKEPASPDITDLPQLPEGWIWATVQQIGRTTTGFTPPKNDESHFGGNIPFFKPSDLDVGYYVRDFRESLTQSGAEHGRVLPPLSILVTCIGATIGKTGLARVNCATNQQINALTVMDGLVSPQFIYWCFTSPVVQRQIIDNASATTLPILNKSRFEALIMPIPPLEEQFRIVAEVEQKLSVVMETERVVSSTLQRIIRLRQSILQKAFSGQLVQQNQNDEPVEMLLKRIECKPVNFSDDEKKLNKKKMEPMLSESIESLDQLLERLDSLGGSAFPERLLTAVGLGDDIEKFFDLLREGRNAGSLSVPDGHGGIITRQSDET